MMQLVVLDVNETLFPLDPVAARMTDVGLEGQLELWFARVLRDGIAAAAAGRFATFTDLARHHLLVLLGRAAEDAKDAVAHVLDGFHHVQPHPDVEPGLHALRRADIEVVALTNGSADLTRSFLERADLDGLVGAVHDAAAVGRWKPNGAPYRAVLQEHDVVAGQAALVAVHPWDVLGAQAAGLRGAWLDRDGSRYPPAFGTPDVRAADLPALVDRLVALDHDA